MSIDHVLQNLEMTQKNLLKFTDNKETTDLLKRYYHIEMERLTMYGYNGRGEQLKKTYGGWMQEFDEGDRPAPMPWRRV